QRRPPASAPVPGGRPHHASAPAADGGEHRELELLVPRGRRLSIAGQDDRSVRGIRRLDVQRPRTRRAASRDRRPGHGELLPMIGARPRVGRLLVTADEGQGAPPVAVLTYAYWQR